MRSTTNAKRRLRSPARSSSKNRPSAADTELEYLRQFAFGIRRVILEQSKRAHVGHIGSSLSIADIIAVLYGAVLHLPGPRHPNRDRFVLSKGHAVLAVYGALFQKGWINEKLLNSYCCDDSLLGSHPEQALPGIDFSTGSLGHGLSMATGAALAARLEGSARRAFALVSDAECNEGSLWEAVMFAAHHRLANLVAIIDQNGQQAMGYTEQVLSLTPMAERWRAFGWDVHDCNGHDLDALLGTLRGLNTRKGKPHVVVAHTVFGRGVSYMERQLRWHYVPMSDTEYQQALQEIGACPRAS